MQREIIAEQGGDHDDFDYEHRIMLHRKSLIYLAHAEQWSEAVSSLLESELALKTAMTRRFQLYLKVFILLQVRKRQMKQLGNQEVRSP